MPPRINPDSGLVRDGTAFTRERLRPTRQIRNPQVTDAGAGQDLNQIARALSEVAPALGRFSDQLAQEKQQSDTLKGQQLARDLSASGKSYAQAIKEGKISPSESPWFRYGAQEQFGRVSASRFSAALNTAILSGPLKDSTDPADFDKFLGDFRSNWLKENVGEATRAFNVGFADSDQDIESARKAFAQIAGKNLESKVLDDAYELQRRTIGNNGTDLDATAKAIKAANDERYALNPNSGREINRTTVKAVIDAARKANDPSILQLLDKIPGGPRGSKLSDIAEFADQIADADAQIRSERNQRYSFEAKQAKQQQSKDVAQTYTDLSAALTEAGANAGSFDIHPFVNRFLALGLGDQTEKLLKLRDAYAHPSTAPEDENLAIGMMTRADRGELTLDAASDAVTEHLISLATYNKLVSKIKRSGASGGDGQPLAVFSERPLSLGIASIKNVFGAEFGFDNREAASRSQLAADEFQANYVAYREGEGADATPEQINAFVQQQRDQLFAKYAGPAIAQGGSIPDLTKIQESVGEGSKAAPAKASAPPGPQPLDWKKEPVTDAQTFSRIVAAVEAAKYGRAPLPQAVKDFFQKLGIKSQADYLEFVKQQNKLIAAQQ
jgi:hypothetical protein